MAKGMRSPTAQDIVWVDWGRHRRTHSLCERLSVDLVEIDRRGSRLKRYLWNSLDTFAEVRKRKPRVVIATNPSIVLGYLLLLMRPLFRFRLVSDAHFLGVKAVHANALLQKLLDFHNARADLVIVTNDNHARLLADLRAVTFVCEDPLPTIPDGIVPAPPNPAKTVFLIASFDVDEPLDDIFKAFDNLRGDGYVLFVSGNYRKSGIDPAHFPGIRFLGFVSEHEYFAHLRAADVVLDLTTVDDCLVCGAYEAMALRKPLVISNTRALADYFGAAAVLTENEPAAIERAIRTAYEHAADLSRKTDTWTAASERAMNARISALRSELARLVAAA
jgi:glycosyltransferase involved in cell wall biosynthesis